MFCASKGSNPESDVTHDPDRRSVCRRGNVATGRIFAAPFSSPANLRAEEAGARVVINMGKAGVYFPTML